MKLGDFLNKMAAKIGVQNDQTFIDLLSSSAIAQQEVNDDLANRFDRELMSLDGAKNNREVLSHFKPIILKSADDKFAILAEKYGIADTINAEQSTYKKIDLLEAELARKIQEAEEKAKSNQTGKGEEVTRLTKQISDLQQQLANITSTKDNELAEYKRATARQQLDMLVNFELNGKRYANQELGDTNVTIARALIEKAMNEQKATLVNENGTLRLKQTDNPSLDFLDSGYKPVKFADFVDGVLAEKHMLEVSNPHAQNNGGGSGNQYNPQYKQITLPNGKQVDTSGIDAAASAAIADLGE